MERRPTNRLLTADEVLELTGYKSRVTLWRKVRSQVFPAPVKLNGFAIRWRETDVKSWIDEAPIQTYGAAHRS